MLWILQYPPPKKCFSLCNHYMLYTIPLYTLNIFLIHFLYISSEIIRYCTCIFVYVWDQISVYPFICNEVFITECGSLSIARIFDIVTLFVRYCSIIVPLFFSAKFQACTEHTVYLDKSAGLRGEKQKPSEPFS